MILIRRTGSGEVYYRYLGHQADVAYETWSSSKPFAVAGTAVPQLRQSCPDGKGLAGSTVGKHGSTPLADLVTIICSYDRTANYTSNALARWFLDLGGRPRLEDLTKRWLGDLASLGGNYGEPSPQDLRFGEVNVNNKWCPIAPNHSEDGSLGNSLSALDIAELLRRLVMHRELPISDRFPGLQWEDIELMLYGGRGNNNSENSLFPADLTVGGMSADTSVYLQKAVNPKAFNQSAGKWKIHSKLGAGYSTSRNVGEITSVAYGCFPVLDNNGAPIMDQGLELVVASRAIVPTILVCQVLWPEYWLHNSGSPSLALT